MVINQHLLHFTKHKLLTKNMEFLTDHQSTNIKKWVKNAGVV